MKYILDTHTVLWHFNDSLLMSAKAKELITNPVNDIYISACSLWEIAIKNNLGKLILNFGT